MNPLPNPKEINAVNITDVELARIASIAHELEELRLVGAKVTQLREHVESEHKAGASVVRIDTVRGILGWRRVA